jgi:hypothetical protein
MAMSNLIAPGGDIPSVLQKHCFSLLGRVFGASKQAPGLAIQCQKLIQNIVNAIASVPSVE